MTESPEPIGGSGNSTVLSFVFTTSSEGKSAIRCKFQNPDGSIGNEYTIKKQETSTQFTTYVASVSENKNYALILPDLITSSDK